MYILPTDRMEEDVASLGVRLKKEMMGIEVVRDRQRMEQADRGEERWREMLDKAVATSEHFMEERLDMVGREEGEVDRQILKDDETLVQVGTMLVMVCKK